MNFKEFVLFNDNDIFRSFYLKEMIKPLCYIYYCRDYLRGVKYWQKHGDIMEPLHIAKADISLANSTYLAEYLSMFNSNSHYIGQGYDLSIFNSQQNLEEPDDMKNISKPRIGYVGSINKLRINPLIIKAIADAKKEYQIILVGPEDDYFKNCDLHVIKNIHFLGEKKLENVPSYINSFDVCINPQIINNVTIGNYPLKIDEYLAMGKPVVATNTKAMEIFKHYALVADYPEQYPELIEQSINDDNADLKAMRKSFASTHSWSNSVHEMIDHILNCV